jgi:hypothetical protein
VSTDDQTVNVTVKRKLMIRRIRTKKDQKGQKILEKKKIRKKANTL